MSIGTINNKMCTALLLTTLYNSCLCTLQGAGNVPVKQYWTSPTNIVATVSAYQYIKHLPSGEPIPVYSTDIEKLCTNYYAILFYVVSPPECSGKYFKLEEHESRPIFSSDYLPPVYKIGELYYFTYMPSFSHDKSDANSFFGIVSNDLFSVSASSEKKMFVGRVTGGNVYYSTEQEAIDALNALKKEHDDLMEKIQSLAYEIENMKLTKKSSELKKNPLFRRLKGRFLDLKTGSLPSNEYKQKNIRMQIEKHRQLNNDIIPKG